MRPNSFITTVFCILLLCFCRPTPAQQGIRSQKFESPAARWRDIQSRKSTRGLIPDSKKLFELQSLSRPEGNWGGTHCPTATEMRALVDSFLAAPNPNFPGLGSTIPGTSVAWSSSECGTFNYAAGLRNVENNKQLTPATPMGIASMTKPIIARSEERRVGKERREGRAEQQG